MFIAINYIDCSPDYQDRFRELFATRAGAIDKMPGFHWVKILEPGEFQRTHNNPDADIQRGNEANGSDASGWKQFLIMSAWDSEDCFRDWTGSPEFVEGHKRGFADMRKYKEEGKEPPMRSTFKTYKVIAD